MPDDRSEIPTPEVAQHHSHLKSIAHLIPHLDPEAQILIFLGRDVLQVHKVREQREDNRDFLRFLWFKENDPDQEIVEYHMKVHVFGNSPSPAVAIYGLHQAAEHGAGEYGVDAKHFVERNFYVNDGLMSLPSATEAIDLLTRTQEMLAASNLRLQKIASNCSDVLKAFPQDDHAKGLQNLDFDDNSALIQHSLGLSWEQ